MAERTQKNGNIWKIVGVILSIACLGAAIVGGYTELGHQVKDNCASITVLKPDVRLNNEHRITDEVDSVYIKQDVIEIKGTLDRFITEQRAVNERILERLPR